MECCGQFDHFKLNIGVNLHILLGLNWFIIVDDIPDPTWPNGFGSVWIQNKFETNGKSPIRIRNTGYKGFQTQALPNAREF